MKKLWLSLLALALVAAFVAPSGFAAAKGKKKKKQAGPVVVGTDDAGDWGSNVDATIAPLGAAIGQELVEATIGMGEEGTVNFVIKVAGLPPTGGIPEFARYSWDFTVNGDAFGMSGNFTDYARGVCYPAHTDSCPPPKDPGMQPFYIRQGPCTIGTGGLGECNLMATVHATFDPAEGTITIPVPLDVIGAKPKAKIGPGTNSVFGGTIYSSPSAVSASPNSPHDVMVVDRTFVVPKGK